GPDCRQCAHTVRTGRIGVRRELLERSCVRSAAAERDPEADNTRRNSAHPGLPDCPVEFLHEYPRIAPPLTATHAFARSNVCLKSCRFRRSRYRGWGIWGAP